MKINIYAIGHLKSGPEKDLCDKYFKRLKVPIKIIELNPKGLSTPEKDAALLQPFLHDTKYICLDEKGTQLTSQSFADLLKGFQLESTKELAFVIGGADGIAPDILKKAHSSLSFGNVTWPHMLVRALLIEQLYRAQQIISGHPYHRD